MDLTNTVLTDAGALLLKKLQETPTDLAAVEKILTEHHLGSDQITKVASLYLDSCFFAFAENEYDSPSTLYHSSSAIDPSLPGACLPDLFRLLLKYGLEANSADDDVPLLTAVTDVYNGYVSADTLKLLLENGGDLRFHAEKSPDIFGNLDDDIYFDAFEQRNRRIYDARIHCWFVMLAHLHNEYNGKEIVTICNRLCCNNDLPPFKIEDLWAHENYGYCLTAVPGNGKSWSLHIFDRRTGCEVARL